MFRGSQYRIEQEKNCRQGDEYVCGPEKYASSLHIHACFLPLRREYCTMSIVSPMAEQKAEGRMGNGLEGELAGYSLVWSDEFDGAAGSPPDPRFWEPETGG